MNSIGARRPRLGWFQRTSASARDEPAGVRVDDRLIEDFELVRLEALADSDGGLEAPDGVGVHVGPVHLEAPFAVALGEVHREIGVAQEFVGRLLRSLADGDADARPASRHRWSRTRNVGVRASVIRSATTSCRFGHRSRLDQHRELVATEPGDRVAGPRRRAEPLGHGDQQRSPAGWPKLSLTVLKSSRSKNRTATGSAPRSPLSMAWESRSRNSARLAKPVSVSWKAW